jgi:hypothetical protein
MTEDEFITEMYKAFDRGYKERQPEIDALRNAALNVLNCAASDSRFSSSFEAACERLRAVLEKTP